MIFFQLVHLYSLDIPDGSLFQISTLMFYLKQKTNIVMLLSLIATTKYFNYLYRSFFMSKWVSDYSFSLALILIQPSMMINMTAKKYFSYVD